MAVHQDSVVKELIFNVATALDLVIGRVDEDTSSHDVLHIQVGFHRRTNIAIVGAFHDTADFAFQGRLEGGEEGL